MLSRVKNSKTIKTLLYRMVRDNQVTCSEYRVVSYLRAIGIAKLAYQDDLIIFTSPIIRDCLLQVFYPMYDSIQEIMGLGEPLPQKYMLTVLLKALSYIKAPEILDPLVTYSKGLAEATVHAELYRILHALFRNQSITILTETRVVSCSDDRRMRCDIWMKTLFAEFG